MKPFKMTFPLFSSFPRSHCGAANMRHGTHWQMTLVADDAIYGAIAFGDIATGLLGGPAGAFVRRALAGPSAPRVASDVLRRPLPGVGEWLPGLAVAVGLLPAVPGHSDLRVAWLRPLEPFTPLLRLLDAGRPSGDAAAAAGPSSSEGPFGGPAPPSWCVSVHIPQAARSRFVVTPEAPGSAPDRGWLHERGRPHYEFVDD